MNKVFVGNLPWTVSEADLAREFSEFGEVTEAKVLMDRETGRSKGFAFITFASADSVAPAIQRFNNADWEGRPMRVSIAENKPRPERGAGGGRGGPREGGFGGGQSRSGGNRGGGNY